MNRVALIPLLLSACVELPAVGDTEQDVCAGTCVPPPPPLTAPDAFVTARTATSLTVKFTDSLIYSSALLQHRLPGAAWANLASYGSVSGLQSKVHAALASDSIHCYRVWATNGTANAYGKEVCGLTQTPNDVAINRIQLHVVVADVTDAGTADNLGVALSEEAKLPGANWTGMNYGPTQSSSGSWSDDFQRGRDFTYDLDTVTSYMNPDRTTGWSRIATLRDISKIKLTKIGTDAVCFSKIELLVNGAVAFSKPYGTTSTTCKWMSTPVNQGESLEIPFSELRAAPSFTGFVAPTPPLHACTEGICLTIPRLELEQRLEGTIGSKIWASKDIYWGQVTGRAVEFSHVSSTRLHVDLDLAASVTLFPDPAVDVDFDIDVALSPAGNGGWDLQFNVSDFTVNATFNVWGHILGVLLAPVCAATINSVECVSGIENIISDAGEAAFQPQSQRIPLLAPGQCRNTPVVYVTADGSVTVGCQLNLF